MRRVQAGRVWLHLRTLIGKAVREEQVMKPSKLGLVGAVVMALSMIAARPAAAHTLRSRPAPATIETMDTVACTVRLLPTHGKAPVELVLTRQTRFIRDWRFAPASELKPGTHAVVYYRTPFFGRPFATKVVWVKAG